MCIETVIVALIVLLVLYVVVQKLVPGDWKQIGYAIVIGIAVIWLFSGGHLHGLLHLHGC